MRIISICKFQCITNHIGKKQDQQSLFFAAPPKNLGKILSAQSNYMKNDRAKYCLKRMTIFSFCFLCAIYIGYFSIDNQIFLFEQGVYFYIWISVLLALGALIDYSSGIFKRSCSYVGENGVVEYTINAGGSIKKSVIYFSDNIKLYKNIFRIYKSCSTQKMVYQKTKYAYHWRGVSKIDSLTIKGQYYSQHEQFDEMDYHAQLGIAAKNAWNDYIFAKMLTKFFNAQPIVVNIRGGYRLSFCRGQLLLSRRMSNSTWELNDIEKAKNSEGLLRIYRKKFNGHSRLFNPFDSNVRTIRCCDIPNAEQIIKLINLVAPHSLHIS